MAMLTDKMSAGDNLGVNVRSPSHVGDEVLK